MHKLAIWIIARLALLLLKAPSKRLLCALVRDAMITSMRLKQSLLLVWCQVSIYALVAMLANAK